MSALNHSVVQAIIVTLIIPAFAFLAGKLYEGIFASRKIKAAKLRLGVKVQRVHNAVSPLKAALDGFEPINLSDSERGEFRRIRTLAIQAFDRNEDLLDDVAEGVADNYSKKDQSILDKYLSAHNLPETTLAKRIREKISTPRA